MVSGTAFVQPDRRVHADTGNVVRSKVRLFNIAYFLIRDDGVMPPVMIQNQAFNLPPIGEYVDIDEVRAVHLLESTQWYDPNRGMLPGMTMDPTYARAVASGVREGDLKEAADLVKVQRRMAFEDATVDELVAALKKHGVDIQANTYPDEDRDTEDPVVETDGSTVVPPAEPEEARRVVAPPTIRKDKNGHG